MPGGERCCGGDLLFSGMALLGAYAEDSVGKMPLLMMPSGAVAIFQSQRAHGTINNHHNCPHVSAATQLPWSLLQRSISQSREEVQRELLAAGSSDAQDMWSDPGVAWLPVHVALHQKEHETSNAPEYTSRTMFAIPFCRCVLYDVQTGQPLVLYDASGGLSGAALEGFCTQFEFLHENHEFDMNRSAVGGEGHASGAQRMRMCLLHNRIQHMHQPPESTRPQHGLHNPGGNLDAYCIHFDDPQFSDAALMPSVAAMEERMIALMPSLSQCQMDLVEAAGVRGRLYSKDSHKFVSRRGLILNMGLSDSYASPCHCDARDAAWCVAFSGKCPANRL